MSNVTDEDMKAARAFVVDIVDSPTPEYRDEVERDLAAAFAEERKKARAPFLTLAEELETQAAQAEYLADQHRTAGNIGQGAVFAGKKVARRDAAARIRRAAEVDQ